MGLLDTMPFCHPTPRIMEVPHTVLTIASHFYYTPKMADIAAANSLAEINAQRIAAGLAPIDESAIAGDGEPVIDEDDVAAQNYAQRRDEMRRAKEEKDIKERISK